jgi:hypothetical protein
MGSTKAKLRVHGVTEITCKFRRDLSNGVALPACSTTPEAAICLMGLLCLLFNYSRSHDLSNGVALSACSTVQKPRSV